jgi:trimeric autotransporter adhesin
MKRIFRFWFLFVLMLTSGGLLKAQTFNTRWNLATAGSGATQLSFGTATSGTVNYDWQEVSPGTASGSGSFSGSTLTITGLPAGAIIRLRISPTNFQRIIINNGADKSRLLDVEQWGTTVWTSMANAFYGCNNLNITATDIPVLTSCTSLSAMFRNCTILNGPSNINSWNTAAVTNMSYMFNFATSFNQNISGWNTGALTTTVYMFSNANAFNQPIGVWNTSNVTDMNNMFRDGTPAFNQDVSNWNVSNVTNMSAMFKGASSFNNGGSPNINNWNVTKVTNMSIMFADCTVFNQPLNNWNISNVTSLSHMFTRASAFNQNIGSWNTIKVNTIQSMFSQAYAFNNGGSPTINNWNTALVTTMEQTFSFAYAFNQPIGNWNTNNVKSIFAMFWVASSFNQNIGSWNVSQCTNFQSTFGGAVSFNNGGSPSINNWNVSNVTNLQDAFGSTAAFQQPLNNWNVSNVTNMRQTFKGSGFNQDISSWNTIKVTNMLEMFSGATAFNQNIGSWNTAAVTNMSSMFSGATAFNQNIGSWNLNANFNLSGMLDNSGMDCYNYGVTLVGWNANPSTPNGRSLGATGRTYGPQATAARANLVGAKGWTITGDALSANSCGAFITRWNLATAGSGATQLSIGTATSGTVNYYWQEVSPGTSTGSGSFSGTTLTINGLPTGATIRLFIYPTNFQRININNGADRSRLLDVEQWGSTVWTSMEQAFRDCNNLNITASDIPVLTSCTSMLQMFQRCSTLNGPTNINSWNTAAVTNMVEMFEQATLFNQNIGSWNTAAVTNMAEMFRVAIAFNQNIGSWNTGAVTNMTRMFSEAAAFNQNIGGWNTGAVTNMSSMFQSATAFNQNIGSWNTGAVTDMQQMFYLNPVFNQNISSWNTGAVTNMSGMFNGATAFNQNLGYWTLNANVNLSDMLSGSGLDCSNYSATLMLWNVNPSVPTGRNLGATGRTYGPAATTDRANLIGAKGWTISGDALNASCVIMLPVTWLDFTGQLVTNKVILNWKTASEQNNTGFDVERSADGRSWSKIGFIPGKINSALLSSYSYSDLSPLKGLSYYRLKQIDLDDKFTYSSVVRINYVINGEVAIWPNPVKDLLNIEINQRYRNEKMYLTVTDMKGTVLVSRIATHGNLAISTSGWPKALYVVTLKSEDGIMMTRKILKQ